MQEASLAHTTGGYSTDFATKINIPNISKVKFDLDFQKSQFGKVGRLDLNTILSMHAIHYSTAHYFSAANQP